MTAESHLPLELPDLSNNSTGNSTKALSVVQIETDHKSPFPKFSPPSDSNADSNASNGINHHLHDDDDDDDETPKDDAEDSSFVFVTCKDDSPLPLDKDEDRDRDRDRDQDQRLNASAPLESGHGHSHHPTDLLQNGKLAIKTTSANATTSIDGVGILHLEDSMDICDGNAFLVGCTAAGEAVQQNGGGGADTDVVSIQLDDHQIDSESSPAPRDNQESEITVSVRESDVGLVESPKPEPEVTSLDVIQSIVVCQESQEDGLDSISQLQVIQQFPHSSLEATISKSPEFEVCKPNSIAQQHLQSFDEVGGTQESQNAHSDATQCEPQLTEVRRVNLEEQIGRDSTAVVEEWVECGMPLVTMEESKPSEFDKSRQRDEGETKIELFPEAKVSQETVISPGSKLDQGIEAENSVDEVDLLSATATECDPLLNENRSHSPVSSFNGYVPDIKESCEYSDDSETHINESNEYADNSETYINGSIERTNDSEKPLELHQSSSNADNLVPLTSCLDIETDIESVKDLQDSAKEHEFQYEASPLQESVIANNDEVCKPETKDVGNVVVQSIEEVPDISGEHEIQHASYPLSENIAVDADEVIKSETEVVSSVSQNLEGAISSPVSDLRSEIIHSGGVNNTTISGTGGECFANTTISGIEFEFGTVDSKDKMSTSEVDAVQSKTEVDTLDVECADTHSMSSVAEVKFEVKNSSVTGGQDMPCSYTVASQTGVSGSTVVISERVPDLVAEIKDGEDQGDQLSDLVVESKGKDMEKSHSNEISAQLPGNSSTDASAGQDVGFVPLMRPFHFLVRIPRFDDLKVREQIQHAQLQVEEKTKLRDAFRLEIQKHKANCHGHAAEYEAAMSKARTSKRSVKSKRTEIDSLQSVINKVKNAISVEDIDARIYSMEHMIQHETLPLKEEKQYIREIKQLKQLREHLSSNIGSQEEVQKALNDRDEIEERLKFLKKELDNLKEGVLKAEAVARAAQKKYEDESKMLKELISQFEAANDIRQAAYHHLQSLKRELFEKNKQFRTYKDNAATATNYAASKDRGALHHLCVNQVETIMDLWNKNDEFRKEYVNCNMRSTLRRLGTLDGRSLGPDEEPPVLTSLGVERIDRLVSNRSNNSPMLQTRILKQETPLKVVEDVPTDDSTKVKEVEAKIQTTKSREPVKPILGNGLATISGRGISDDENSEKVHMPTEEELELARKAEELRKVEAAAKLREQRRLEEKAKALEALERKKRIAEKAQMRAELRAQKEAELREKEREKRLRKKERKRACGAEVPDCNNIGESAPSSEILTQTIKEAEIEDSSPAATTKRPQIPSIFIKQSKTKSIPPSLRNRGKRKMQQWMWVIFTCVVVILLFLLGNIGFFSNLSNLRQRSYGI